MMDNLFCSLLALSGQLLAHVPIKCLIDYFLEQGLEMLDTRADPLVSSGDWAVMGESRMQTHHKGRWGIWRRAVLVLLFFWNPRPSFAVLSLSGDLAV